MHKRLLEILDWRNFGIADIAYALVASSNFEEAHKRYWSFLYFKRARDFDLNMNGLTSVRSKA